MKTENGTLILTPAHMNAIFKGIVIHVPDTETTLYEERTVNGKKTQVAIAKVISTMVFNLDGMTLEEAVDHIRRPLVIKRQGAHRKAPSVELFKKGLEQEHGKAIHWEDAGKQIVLTTFEQTVANAQQLSREEKLALAAQLAAELEAEEVN